MSDLEDQAGVPLIEDLSDSPDPQTSRSTKRKREADDESQKAARKKKRTKKKPDDVDDSNLDSELGINRAIAHMDSQLMADHIAQRTRRFQPDLSALELEDVHIPAKAILDTTSFEKPRATDALPDFLDQFAGSAKRKKKLSQSLPDKGSPHTLVITGAGLRAADLTRALRKFETKDSKVSKLFAKHIKLKEAIETVKKTKMGIGVGTPQRVIDLLEDGALTVEGLERVVVDASHIDQKKRGVLDMKEVQVPLVKLLGREQFRGRYGKGEGKVELLFF